MCGLIWEEAASLKESAFLFVYNQKSMLMRERMTLAMRMMITGSTEMKKFTSHKMCCSRCYNVAAQNRYSPEWTNWLFMMFVRRKTFPANWTWGNKSLDHLLRRSFMPFKCFSSLFFSSSTALESGPLLNASINLDSHFQCLQNSVSRSLPAKEFGLFLTSWRMRLQASA